MSIQGFSFLAGSPVPEPVPSDMMEALEGVEIVAAIGERGTFRLKFRLDPGSTLPARFLLETGDLVRTVLVVAVGNQPAVVMDGVIPEVIPAPLTDIPAPAERIFHQRGTDYAYIRSLAAEVGYRFTLNPGPLPGASVAYWGPEPRADRSQPSLTVDFERPVNVDRLELRFDTMQDR